MKRNGANQCEGKAGMSRVAGLVTVVTVFLLIAVLSGCAVRDNKDIDREALEAVAGEYQAVEKNAGKSGEEGFVGDWWHLSIQVKDTEAKSPYLSIYDNSAGNPGVEGVIKYIDGEKIIVEINPDYYEDLPSGLWKCDGKTLEVKYEIQKDGIALTNNEEAIQFHRT